MAPRRSYLLEDEAEWLFCQKRLLTPGVGSVRGQLAFYYRSTGA